jgi:uncharacterized protein YndB with AHSA1/START domain
MTEMNSPAALVGDREIAITRFFKAPPALVFSAWSTPEKIAQWWGPIGFVTTSEKMEFKTGGHWRLVMRGPDGRDYRNRVQYLEIIENQKIVFQHDPEQGDEPSSHKTTVTFAEAPGGTRLEMRMTFASPQARDYIVKTYGAVEGLSQTIGRLSAFVDQRKTGNAAGEFVISRTFNAPREKIWAAWTQQDQFIQWFGPKGCVIDSAIMDVRPGGTLHSSMRMPDGQLLWAKFIYRQVDPPSKLTWVHMFSDKNGGITRHPMVPDWPQQLLSTVTLEPQGAKTLLTLRWIPINATEQEIATFNAMRPSMQMGWTGTFEQLEEFLAK